jgi:hypothetical protein
MTGQTVFEDRSGRFFQASPESIAEEDNGHTYVMEDG